MWVHFVYFFCIHSVYHQPGQLHLFECVLFIYFAHLCVSPTWSVTSVWIYFIYFISSPLCVTDLVSDLCVTPIFYFLFSLCEYIFIYFALLLVSYLCCEAFFFICSPLCVTNLVGYLCGVHFLFYLLFSVCN